MGITRHDTGAVYLLLRERGDRTKLSTLRELFFGKLAPATVSHLHTDPTLGRLSARAQCSADVLTKADTAAKGARKHKKTKQKQLTPEVTQKASDIRLQTALVELQTMGFVKVSVRLLPLAPSALWAFVETEKMPC
eukprot:COSAG02_NODE_1561_length_11924_cov_12.099281_2_plen_136_part_00